MDKSDADAGSTTKWTNNNISGYNEVDIMPSHFVVEDKDDTGNYAATISCYFMKNKE